MFVNNVLFSHRILFDCREFAIPPTYLVDEFNEIDELSVHEMMFKLLELTNTTNRPMLVCEDPFENVLHFEIVTLEAAKLNAIPP